MLDADATTRGEGYLQAPDSEQCSTAGLQQQLSAKSDTCRQLREDIEACHSRRDAACKAGTAGFAAARQQMLSLQAELDTLRRAQPAATTGDEGRGEALRVLPGSTIEADAAMDQTVKQALELRARHLRRELLKRRHQAEMLTAHLQTRQEEVAQLRHSYRQAQEVLEATRQATQRARADLAAQGRASTLEGPPQAAVPLHGGGRICAGVKKECHQRESAEAKGEALAGKTKRLKGIHSAQQLLIRKLEQQIRKEEGVLEDRSAQLSLQRQRQQQLKLQMKNSRRRRSDDAVAVALGLQPRRGSPTRSHFAGPSSIAEDRLSPSPSAMGGRGASQPPGSAGTGSSSERAIKQELVLPAVRTWWQGHAHA